ncbi:MAG: DUF6612 family protein [archaeon]
MQYKYVMVLALLGMLLTACSQELTPEALQSKLVLANSDVNSYTVDLAISTHVQGQAYEQPLDAAMSTISKGKVDRQAKKIFMDSALSSDMTGMKVDLQSQLYVIDNTLYQQILDVWVKTALPQEVWQQQDHMYDIISMINSGSIERLPDEILNDEEYYVVTINPDIKKVVELALREQEQLDLLNGSLNFSDIVQSYAAKIWINKRTFIIEKSTTNIRLIFTPENMGKGEGSLVMDMRIDMSIANVNQPLIITLPEEAGNAVLLEKKSSNVVTGNVIKSLFM